MADNKIELIEMEKLILSSYEAVVSGIVDYLGSGFEAFLYSVEDIEKPIYSSVNMRGRTDSIKLPADKLSPEIKDKNFVATAEDGENYKCSLMPIKAQDKLIAYLLITFRLDTPVYKMFPRLPYDFESKQQVLSETFADSIGDILDKTVKEVKDMVLADNNISNGRKKRMIIKELHSRGIFNIKDSVSRVTVLLNVSRNTVYMYLREIEAEE